MTSTGGRLLLQDERPLAKPGKLHVDTNGVDHGTGLEPGLSSEDETSKLAEPDAEDDDLLGFSMSRQQTYLKSPQTPVAEKIKALEDSNGRLLSEIVTIVEELSQSNSPEERDDPIQAFQPVQNSPSGVELKPEQRLAKTPSPWKASGSEAQGWSWSMGNAFTGKDDSGRGRSLSMLSVLEGLRKHMPDMPGSKRAVSSSKLLKVPPKLRPQSHFSAAHDESKQMQNTRPTTDDERMPQSASNVLTTPYKSRQVKDDTSATPASSKASLHLRRSHSDNSLYVRRTSTAQSTLDDLDQFADISEMINSRFKAVTDTLQDSSFRRPKMPNINLATLKANARSWSSNNIPGMGPPADGISSSVGTGKVQAAIEKPSQRAHPILADALSKMEGDVVVLGGYRGSILRSAKPPYHQLWAPVKMGMNWRKADLEVGLTREDEERMEETIFPDGTLSHIGPIDICRRLLKHLRKCPNTQLRKLRVHDYGYDWRLSPDYLAERFLKYLEGLVCNQPDVPTEKRGAWVIAHSMGGLLTRYIVNKRPDLFAGVLYAGTPQNCVNILGPLRNGDDVLRNSRVLNAQVTFTLRSSYVLLPESGRCFLSKETGERYDIDFFDPQTWDDHRLSPCIKHAAPPATKEQKPKSLIDAFTSSIPRKLSVGPWEWPAKEGESSTDLPPDTEGALEPSMPKDTTTRPSIATATTIPVPLAKAYLNWVLASVLAFKKSLRHNPGHQESNLYPPHAIIYSKNTPTVYGAYVSSREAIKQADAYEDLAFASGDGVVLASAAQLPEGYRVVRGGKILSDRGHVGLLGDLESVGRCLNALIEGRERGIGVGKRTSSEVDACGRSLATIKKSWRPHRLSESPSLNLTLRDCVAGIH